MREIMAIIASLQTNALTAEIIDNLYLHLHSLKGECNVMGFNEIGSICEQALTILKEEKVRMTNNTNLLNTIGDNINTINLEINKLSQTRETSSQQP